MRKSGDSIKDIAFNEEMTIDAVKGVIKRSKHQDEGQDNKRPDRPSALSDRDKKISKYSLRETLLSHTKKSSIQQD
jgi:hypothetical protein